MTLAHHPNIVSLMGIVTQSQPLIIVMEYCAGVFDVLHQQDHVELIWSQMVAMCSNVATAMEYLHRFTPCIIHRDLKSLNILLAEPIASSKDMVRLKVSDFGLARTLEALETEDLTRGLGTRNWMAPEMLLGKHYNEKVDVYSYGMVLFEILCRMIPYAGVDASMLPDMVVAGKRPPLKEFVVAECPESMHDLIAACWDSDP
eukprot:CAMPEP_0180650558 /NCGR_PEP_ID=MMETSP1037_2-20121125/52317_1 /TAXON_ID=632150 /ORGANISM="Azadinium spinosum, Strain 3D9" /LENGTH=201 /DNA_ID=CAMNT_0022675951 /DNA_START=95 /DNA_END=698 /DNA_ORIENTATION=-